MIECIFTIDYEIYGNGLGSLGELVYEPTKRLIDIFQRSNARFVTFVEAAELEMIKSKGTDSAIEMVEEQVWQLHKAGFEIGLHLHPQWYNARREEGSWVLDYSEYNLCTLKRERIEWMVDKGIEYLRRILKQPGFTPVSFRAGNWLLQPSHKAAAVLAEKGIRVDSSVFKGGLQRGRGLDYRPALRNGDYWNFQDDVNKETPGGRLLEIPIYTRLVPFWRMFTGKRLALQQKASTVAQKTAQPSLRQRVSRVSDLLRLRYPLKFDFCRMTLDELTTAVDGMIEEDKKTPACLKPLVAIGHTKDLKDYQTIVTFLAYLKEKRIKVSTLEEVYDRCRVPTSRAIPNNRAMPSDLETVAAD
jgi:hypothetical protein